jgi:hypothetical protein
MTRKKIRDIEISSFRGIPGQLSLSFVNNRTGTPNSAIISGDNGSGKSSIADAVEFCLQRTINKVGVFPEHESGRIRSLFSDDNTFVRIAFEDDSEITRGVKPSDNSRFIPTGKTHDSFSISPIVLRRTDILKFWDTPEHKRQVLLWRYFKLEKPKGRKILSEKVLESINQLERTRINLKKDRRSIEKDLYSALNMAGDHILIGDNPSKFVHDVIYEGRSKKERQNLQRRGVPFNTNEKALELASKYVDLTAQIRGVQSDLKKKKQFDRDEDRGNSLQKEKMLSILTSASEWVTNTFLKIIPNNQHIRNIELKIGDINEVSLNVEVTLSNDAVVDPTYSFSEANRDLLALLIYISIHRRAIAEGQEKLLILDDVFQSVDSTIRYDLVNTLLTEFIDWQLIITVHDRLWLEQLKTLFQHKNKHFQHVDIIRWSSEAGPVINQNNNDASTRLELMLQNGDVDGICSLGGLLLEKICNNLSITLPISVIRKPNDRYTLGDLWPGVFKKLKNTNLAEFTRQVNELVYLRNIIGAHFNEWALALSRHESEKFGNAILNLYNHVYCPECASWVKSKRSKSSILYECRCQNLSVKKLNPID